MIDEAIQYFEEYLKRRKAVPNVNPAEIINNMNLLAICYMDSGKYVAAISLFDEILRIQTANLAANHPDVMKSKNNLAVCYLRAKQFDKSIPLFEELVKYREAKLTRKHPETIDAFACLGSMLPGNRQITGSTCDSPRSACVVKAICFAALD